MKTSRQEQSLLIQKAVSARSNAYAPYSNFHVGAALMTDDGEIFDGCNIENSSYSLTICAERAAVFKAVSAGKKKLRSLAVTSDDRGFITPCGACRQVLSEFSPALEIILVTSEGKKKVTTLDKLFPVPPDLKKLSKGAE
ncbi:MAG: cytidine deaminase [Bacteroidota bacterium]|nr:cytidine deaminase [Bacteroidota bacterium]